MEVELTLLTLSLLFFLSIFTDKIGYKFGVPALLLFLGVGMLFGPDGIGRFFEGTNETMSADTAQGISTIALCIILFSGGMGTKISEIRPVLAPGIMLATIGVLLTALITGVIIYYVFGAVEALHTMSFSMALLIAATMSSTDSASVFSILRTNGIGLKHNLRPLLELESGANDPMAYILTTTMIGIVIAPNQEVSGLEIMQSIVIQLIMGAVIGFLFGKGLIELMRRVRLSNESLYPIMVLTACIFIFSATYFMKGNPYLAVYVGGVIIGNSKFTRKHHTKQFFDGLTWLSQLVMFLMLGMMVRPSEMLNWQTLLVCLIISIIMIFISRPLSVFISMFPFKEYDRKDKLFVSWVGLKGAVPIIFAIMCKAQGVERADVIFNVIFLCTLVSLLTQGSSLSSMAEKLQLAIPQPKLKRLEHFDLDLPEEIESSATELEITEEMLAGGRMLRNISMPGQTLVILVRRGEDFFVPTGTSELEVGDQLLIITDDDAALANRYRAEEAEQEGKEWRMQLINHTKDFIKTNWKKISENKNEKNNLSDRSDRRDGARRDDGTAEVS